MDGRRLQRLGLVGFGLGAAWLFAALIGTGLTLVAVGFVAYGIWAIWQVSPTPDRGAHLLEYIAAHNPFMREPTPLEARRGGPWVLAVMWCMALMSLLIGCVVVYATLR
jgi:hypothetical protein